MAVKPMGNKMPSQGGVAGIRIVIISLLALVSANQLFFAVSGCGPTDLLIGGSITGRVSGPNRMNTTTVIVIDNELGDNVTAEDLMYKYKSDKSRDDHGYTKVYDMIFSPIRGSVSNMTEVGIAAGQSLQAWYRYFPCAEVHAFDVLEPRPAVRDNLDRMKSRVRAHIVDILSPGNDPLNDLGFLPESMDVIIEDGPHSVSTQQEFLVRLFPLLKAGGYYVIEDVGSGQRGPLHFHERPEMLNKEARDIIESNDAIWVDASLGHRAWGELVRRVGEMWAKDRLYHNSYMVVIKKRSWPLREVQMNYGAGAMSDGAVVKEEEEE